MSNGETADTIHNVGKVQLADSLRLMADNQRTLNRTNADDQRRRDLHARIEEAEATKKMNGIASAPQKPTGDEDMQILVDSPTTVHHNYPPPKTEATPEPKKPAGTLAKAALAAALLGTGAGGGVAVPWALGLFNQQPPPVETPVDSLQQIVVE